MVALKFLNMTEILNADEKTYGRLKDCAKTAVLSTGVRDSIRYFDLVKQLTTEAKNCLAIVTL